MGAKYSTELLQVPLQAVAPARLSLWSTVTTVPTSWRIHIPTWKSTFHVFENKTKLLLFEIKTKTLSTRYNFHASNGEVLMSMKGRTFQDEYRLYEGAETEQEFSTIRVRSGVLSSTVVTYCDFTDHESGRACRLLMEGDLSDRVAVVYFASNADSQPLPPVEKKHNTAHDVYTAVGRLHKPKESDNDVSLEAAPGVDATLLLLLWLARFDLCMQLEAASTSCTTGSG